MRKTFVLAALALVMSAGSALATTTLSLDGYCNAYVVRVRTGQVTAHDSGCSNGFGAGLVGSLHGEGKNAVVGLTDPASEGVQFVFKFSYPFVTGGTWTLYSTTNGVTMTTVLSGNYTIPAPGGDKGIKGRKSVTGR